MTTTAVPAVIGHVTTRDRDGLYVTHKATAIDLHPGWVTFTEEIIIHDNIGPCGGERYSVPSADVVAVRWL